jgi:hypothetical protein
MNIQWLSPLDPQKTEIGRYSQNVLPALRSALSLGVVTDSIDKREQYDCEKHVLGMEPLNIYNIGNSYLHCGILRVAMQHPGIIILHDVSLLELGLAMAREDPEFALRDLIVAEHGYYAGRAFDDIYSGMGYEWCGQSQAQYDYFVNTYPLFKTFIKNAYGVIVHSDYALERVKSSFSGPVIKLNLPYPVRNVNVHARRHEAPCQIVFCGHAGPNRRLKQFIEAWAQVSQPNYFRLSLYGNIDKAAEILALADNLGLQGLINIVGFVDEETLEAAISSSHLALNLRNPTMGEASASQLRYWSSATPSLVSDVGWYSELPHNAVIKVSPEDEKHDIISVLEQFILGNKSYLESGLKGFQYLCDEHGVERYVGLVAKFVEDMAWQRFIGSIFDKRLIVVMGSMCAEVDDTVLFENTMLRVSEMVSGLEQPIGKQ